MKTLLAVLGVVFLLGACVSLVNGGYFIVQLLGAALACGITYAFLDRLDGIRIDLKALEKKKPFDE
jgi:hypothetical protein